MKLGDAKGISGGGLWAVSGASAGELWSPSTHAKLIGVAVAWNTRDTEYCEPATLWGDWVRAVMQLIDGTQ
jgi:hypothetical protein